MPNPSIGRIVHFVDPDGQHHPAIVTNALAGEKVNLTVFPDLDDWNETYEGVEHFEPVFVDDAPDAIRRAQPGTWHWPEREE